MDEYGRNSELPGNFSESLLYQNKKENLSNCLGTDATSQTDRWTGSRDPDVRQSFFCLVKKA
jgi:hypothetical protein